MKYYNECGAKRRNGEPCKGAAMPNGRCRLHGGKMPSGLGTRATKHGRYSKDIPTRLIGRYEEAQHDTELLALRDEIALLDARLSDVLGRVDTGESGRIWTDLKAAAADLLYARRTDNQAEMAIALNTMLDLVRSGHQDYAAWQDVRSLLEQRRRTVESERKRLVEAQQMISAQQVTLLAVAFAAEIRDAAQRNIPDQKERRRFLQDASTRIERLLSVGDSARIVDG